MSLKSYFLGRLFLHISSNMQLQTAITIIVLSLDLCLFAITITSMVWYGMMLSSSS